MNSITTSDLAALGDAALIVDVREDDEFLAARVAGALSIPLSVLTERASEIPDDRTVYIMCLSGGRSARAVAYLTQRDLDVVNVLGGITEWQVSGLPVESGALQ